MRVFITTKENPRAFYDPIKNIGFIVGSPQHDAMKAEVAAGRAKIQVFSETVEEQRLRAYTNAGLTADGWLEAIVETLGNTPGGFRGTKFQRLWEEREKIRAKYPKT